MRPKSIVLFERVVLFSLVLGILNSVLVWDRVTAEAAAQGLGSGTLVAIQVLTIAIYLLLIWFIARKASPVAKWIYVVLTALGVVAALAGAGKTREMGAATLLITLFQYALLLFSVWLLFKPDSKAWFADGREDASGHSSL
jgi:hypothetical protein